MLRIREFHGMNEEDNRIERKIRDDIRQMLTESNTINDEADVVADEIYKVIRYQKFDKAKIVEKEIQREINGKNIKLKEYYFSINSTFKQKPILTTVYIFQFPTDEDYDFFIESGGKSCVGNYNSYKGKQNFLTIYCYVSPKYIDYGELYSTIWQELSKEEHYFGYINTAYSCLKEKMPIFGNDIFECLRGTELYRQTEAMEKTTESKETSTITKKRLNELKRKTANMLSHYERFVYLRNFKSNPPCSPIDGI